MITVYGAAQTRATRISWILEELELAYHFEAIDFSKGEHKSEAFLAINPAGKVPVIKLDDFVMTESAAIVSHLAERYSNGQLIPFPATEQRGKYQQWCDFVISELEQPLWTMAKHRFALAKELRVAAVIDTAAWEFQQALGLLSQGLAEQDYILGAEFSAADILIAHTLLWAQAFKQPIGQDNLQRYLQRCQQRPALARAIEKEAHQ
ncbi:glutathione S-transferase family protein [Dasania sp. GY-MA-18]|uniref:Glutathione S-transferase family protein n=1 Tax=Dasania phycosphaerae TaxID=2950436 RepID=A0A9J6RJ48_9GAMM|nr:MULTISPECIES: glutathione S-transferase family protein [Dasania]MCR8922016.1 glutathione S-transferase family protein [Dasania sp. GY-MA-18]MCZ0864444.1 glutathione S-transferase family protein [Dasania phycosphaerae]MCZ0868172.1 glutathione S-transferase family protein [Dasania phycosphaerae]